MRYIMIGKCKLCGCTEAKVHQTLAMYVFTCGSARRFCDPTRYFVTACRPFTPEEINGGRYCVGQQPWEHGLIELPELLVTGRK